MTDNSSTWRTSSYSGGSGGQCVEVGQVRGVLVRDSKDNGNGPVLRVTSEGWTNFLRAVNA